MPQYAALIYEQGDPDWSSLDTPDKQTTMAGYAEFGQAAAAPRSHRSEVTVTRPGDRIRYTGGRACHWKVTGVLPTVVCTFAATGADLSRGSVRAAVAAALALTVVPIDDLAGEHDLVADLQAYLARQRQLYRPRPRP